MDSDGLIKRHVHPGMPLRREGEYELTEKGKKLRLALEQTGEFSAQYCARLTFSGTKSQGPLSRHLK